MRTPAAIIAEGLSLALVVAGLASSQAVRAAPAAQSTSLSAAIPDYDGTAISRDARDVASWVVSTGDNAGLPFVLIDKVEAVVMVFDSGGKLQGSAPSLLGLARGDTSPPGIGQRRLATIGPGERVTPAGRFEASLGHDFDQDILWVDYESSLSLHRVVAGKPSERRSQRLASPTPLDNRISYGCINVPEKFYDAVIVPAFTGTIGIVYILPEVTPLKTVFAIP
jgi:hypothetical protein